MLLFLIGEIAQKGKYKLTGTPHNLDNSNIFHVRCVAGDLDDSIWGYGLVQLFAWSRDDAGLVYWMLCTVHHQNCEFTQKGRSYAPRISYWKIHYYTDYTEISTYGGWSTITDLSLDEKWKKPADWEINSRSQRAGNSMCPPHISCHRSWLALAKSLALGGFHNKERVSRLMIQVKFLIWSRWIQRKH